LVTPLPRRRPAKVAREAAAMLNEALTIVDGLWSAARSPSRAGITRSAM
jgi:hypothetical protein